MQKLDDGQIGNEGIASFPGSHARECEHWSCAGVESLVFFLPWEAVIVRGRMRLRTEKEQR